MDLGFAGSTAVVTGGSKGMGLAIAETLAAEGASVAVMARSRGGLDAAVTALRAAGARHAFTHYQLLFYGSSAMAVQIRLSTSQSTATLGISTCSSGV